MAKGALFGFLAGVILGAGVLSGDLYANNPPKMIDEVPYSTVDSVYSHLLKKHHLKKGHYFILIYGRAQKEYVLKKTGNKNFEIIKKYDVSTGRYGFGNKIGSGKTSTGSFKIYQKIGRKAKLGTIFEKLCNTGKIAVIYKEPVKRPEKGFLTTRVITLKGLDSQNKNMLTRGIYIHGTDREGNMDAPDSDGCVRMINLDVIDFDNSVNVGDLGEIVN